MSLMLQILFTEQQALSFPRGKRGAKGKWPITMHRNKVNLFCYNGLRNLFNIPISTVFVCVSDPRKYVDIQCAHLYFFP